MAFRKLRDGWHRLVQQTEWHSQGVPIFDSKLPPPARPQEHDATRRKSPRDAGPDCCAQGRESWRRHARARHLISSNDRVLQPSCQVQGQLDVSQRCIFLDLPVEIREQIYRFAVEDWHSLTPSMVPIPPYEPPICRVSRQIRRESRPLFFSHWRFPIVAHLKPGMYYAPSPRWYRKAEPSDLRAMRKFLLYFCFDMAQSRLGPGRQPPVIYLFDLDEETRKITVTKVFAEATPTLRILDLQALHVQVVQNVLTLEQRYATRGEVTAHDLELLVPESVGL